MPTRRIALALFPALVTAFSVPGCGRRRNAVGTPLPAGSSVLALGDSLTYGTGAPPEAAYPAQLAALTGWHIVNGGVPGDTSAQALERLPALLAEHRPALVIVSLGGNDFLRRVPPAETEVHLRRIVAKARDAGAQVLLVAVPRPTLAAAVGASLDDHPLYERLATELAQPLHANGWAKILADERLKSDQIHANAAGYRAFAEGIAATLKAARIAPAP